MQAEEPPDDFGDLDIAAMGGQATQAVSITDIIKNKPELADELKAHKRAATVPRIAGLLTRPGLHANTIRLEMFVHPATACCHPEEGRRPRGKQLSKWLNDGLAEIAWMEDPVEDVFVANVAS